MAQHFKRIIPCLSWRGNKHAWHERKASFSDILTPALLAVITFLSHFWYFCSFGLYEDDWFAVPRMFWSWATQIGPAILCHIINFSDGRPLHYVIPLTVGGLNAAWGGLPGIYLGGYLIVLANILLFFYLVKRFVPQVVAVTGALLFCLFPADTSRLFINNFHSLQTSLTFLLAASLCYLTQRRVLSYFLISATLLTYETAFWPFLGVPLLQLDFKKERFRQLVRHGLILIGIFVAYTLFRMYCGESRLAGLRQSHDFGWQLVKNAVAMWVGPMVSVRLTLQRPFLAIWEMSWDMGVLAGAVFLLSFFLLWLAPLPSPVSTAPPASKQDGGQRTGWGWSVFELYHPPLQVGLVGFILTFLSYAMSFYHFPVVCAGIFSGSAHMAATFGIALLGSGLFTVLLLWAQARHKKNWAVWGLALFFSLLAAFHVLVQKDFVRGWAYTKQFWGNVLKLCPDATDGTLIFVEDHGGILYSRYICLTSWNHQVIPKAIFRYPEGCKNPPALFVVHKRWREKAFLQGEKIFYGEMVPEFIFGASSISLPPGNVILLIAEREGMVRVPGSIQLGGREFHLKEPGPSHIGNLPRTPIFDLLIDPEGS